MVRTTTRRIARAALACGVLLLPAVLACPAQARTEVVPPVEADVLPIRVVVPGLRLVDAEPDDRRDIGLPAQRIDAAR